MVTRMRRKLEKLKSEFEPLTKLLKDILGDKVFEGNCELQDRRFAVCYHDVGVRLVCQHGANARKRRR